MGTRGIRTGAAVLGLALAGVSASEAQHGGEPLAVARILAERYPASGATMSYIPALAWSGSLRLAAATGEDRWREKALREIRPFLADGRPAAAAPYRLTSLAGAAALSDAAALAGLASAAGPAGEAADLLLPQDPGEVVAHATGWTDDMYMSASLLARVGARTGDPRYAAVAGRVLTTYAARLQRPDGLFVHDVDGPVAWGRGNGFAALGLAEALARLPESWPDRGRVLEVYRRLMEALAAHQSEDGSWRQVVDVPTSYRELTVTAMTVAAMARGVRLGWLDRDTYLPIVARGWEAVAARVAEDGSVRDACTSTGAGTTLEYYLERPAVNGMDDRAGGLALLAALEVHDLRREASPAA